MTHLLSKILNENNVVIESKPMGWKNVYLTIDSKVYFFNHCNGHPMDDWLSRILKDREIYHYLLGDIVFDIEKHEFEPWSNNTLHGPLE
jgi:hypothetical protein